MLKQLCSAKWEEGRANHCKGLHVAAGLLMSPGNLGISFAGILTSKCTALACLGCPLNVLFTRRGSETVCNHCGQAEAMGDCSPAHVNMCCRSSCATAACAAWHPHAPIGLCTCTGRPAGSAGYVLLQGCQHLRRAAPAGQPSVPRRQHDGAVPSCIAPKCLHGQSGRRTGLEVAWLPALAHAVCMLSKGRACLHAQCFCAVGWGRHILTELIT